MKPWTEKQTTWAKAYFIAKSTNDSTEKIVTAYVDGTSGKLSREQALLLISETKASIDTLVAGIRNCLLSGRSQTEVVAEVAWFTGFPDIAESLVSGVAEGMKKTGESSGRSAAPYYLAEPKSRSVALVLSILLGMLGADRFYLGSRGVALAKALTLGGVYCWWIADVVQLFRGKMKDGYGRVVGQSIP